MIASPLRPRHRQEPGIAAAGQLAHRGTPYGASLSFATTTHLWPLPDPPSRKLRSATSRTGAARSIPGRALASSVLDSPCQGSKTGLPPPISTSVPGTPATPRGYAARLATTVAHPPTPATRLAPPAPPIRPPHQLRSPRPVPTNSHSWWTDNRGPVKIGRYPGPPPSVPKGRSRARLIPNPDRLQDHRGVCTTARRYEARSLALARFGPPEPTSSRRGPRHPGARVPCERAASSAGAGYPGRRQPVAALLGFRGCGGP